MFLQDNKSMLPAGINQWLTNRKVRIEIGLTVLSVIGILIHSVEKGVGGDIMMVLMSTQAAFYFIVGYTTPDIEGRFSHLMYKIISLASSIGIIGLLFSLMRFNGAFEMMLISFNVMLFSILILVYCIFYRWNDKLRPLLVRVVVLGVLTTLVRFSVITF